MSASNTLPEIRRTMVFNASIQKVWNAVATSEGIAAWFMSNNFQPVKGQVFYLEAGPFGKSECEVTELDPPRLLSFRWGSQWTATFELFEADGKTEFTLIHAGWDAEKLTEFGEPHTIVRDRMDNGWGGLIQKLRAYVEA